MSAAAGLSAFSPGGCRHGNLGADPTQPLVWPGPTPRLILAAMTTTPSSDRAEAVALARFALISKLQELLRRPMPLRLAS